MNKVLFKKNHYLVRDFILFLLTLGFLKPSAFLAIPTLDTIFNIWRVASVFIILFMIVVSKHNVSIVSLSILAFQAFLFLVTLARDGDVFQSFVNMLTVCGEVLIFDYAIKHNFKRFIRAVSFTWMLLLVLNCVFFFTLPEGFLLSSRGSIMYFLGIHNRFIFWILPGLALIGLDSYLHYNTIKWWVFVVYVFCIIPLILTTSVGGFIGCLIFGISLFVISRAKRQIPWYPIVLAATLLIWVLLVFGNLSNSFTNWLLEIGKTESFGARILLWKQARSFVTDDINHFLFGYGVEPSEVLLFKFTFAHVHNNLLNIIYQSGVVGLLLYALPFVIIIKTTNIYRSNNISKPLIACLISFFVILLADTYDIYGHLYVIAVLAGNIPYIVNKYNQNVFLTGIFRLQKKHFAV